MERINAYFPQGTENINHLGASGNVYKLDAIDFPIRVKAELENNPNFNVKSVSSEDDSLLKLLNVHSPELIEAYRTGKPKELANVSGLRWQEGFYEWVVNKAWSTVYASQKALNNGFSLAMTSGGHHSEYERGLGFGPISNMIVAGKYLLQENLIKKLAILDLDVHFGNGTHSLVKNDKRILSCDLWKYRLNKWKYTPNSQNIYHLKVNSPKEYFEKLDKMFNRISEFKPDLLYVYNGLDVLGGDRMGGIKGFTEKDLFSRNESVSKFVRTNNLPTCVFLGGGYINYAQSLDKIEADKKRLTRLFADSTSSIFGI